MLLPEEDEDEALQEQGGSGRQQHGALLARAMAEHAPEEELVEERSGDAQGRRRRDERERERQPEDPVHVVRDEPPEHVHLPVGEVEHPHQTEDEGEAERDEGVLAPEVDPVDEDLFHPSRPLERPRSLRMSQVCEAAS